MAVMGFLPRSKIADSLEARLDAKLKDRDISKVKPR